MEPLYRYCYRYLYNVNPSLSSRAVLNRYLVGIHYNCMLLLCLKIVPPRYYAMRHPYQHMNL